MLIVAFFAGSVLSLIVGMSAVYIHERFLRISSCGNRLVFWLTPIVVTPLVVLVLMYEFQYYVESQVDGMLKATRNAVIIPLTPALSLYVGLLLSVQFKQTDRKNP